MFYWVNQAGALCLGIGAVCGFAGAGLGYLIGPTLGLGGGGYVLGLFTGGLAIIVADVLYRLKTIQEGFCGPIAAFFWPRYGGTVNFFHASLEGVFFIALGAFVTHVAYRVETNQVEETARKLAARQEETRLKRITRELPRTGIAIEVTDGKNEWVAKLTNRQGQSFGKVIVQLSFGYPGKVIEYRTVEWGGWARDETKTVTEKAGAGRVEFLNFQIEAYPPGLEEPRYYMWIPGRMQNRVWAGVEPPKS